jgi:hypothetical protein
VEVEWPERRADVKAAVELLAAEPPVLQAAGMDPRWPDLTNAVHWLVDDTWWDQTDPASAVGTILRDEEEATAIQTLVSAVVRVAGRQGATSPDAGWFGDPEWPLVRDAAAHVLVVVGRPSDR